MKVLVIDFETTGLDVETLQPLQFAFWLMDTNEYFPNKRKDADIHVVYIEYDSLVFARNDYKAVLMNRKYFEVMGNALPDLGYMYKNLRQSELPRYFTEYEAIWKDEERVIWGERSDGSFGPRYNVCGKNAASFDVPIFEKYVSKGCLGKRVIDPSHYFIDTQYDVTLPDMKKMVERITGHGFETYPEELHDAYYDVYHTALALWLAFNEGPKMLKREKK